jgi:protein transport protein SEC61 subunit gamma-like protein
MGIGTKISSFFVQSKRVWFVLKKPSYEEFKAIAKVSAIGIAIIGALGFVVSDILKLISSRL